MPDELKPAYLIAGGDRPKVDRAVARLRGRFDSDAVELHDAAEATGDDAVAACNALGLFGSGARLVVSLLHELRRRNGRYGLATLCVGVGQGQAALFERPPA